MRASVVDRHSRSPAGRSLVGRNQADRSPGAGRSLGRRVAAAHKERYSRHRDGLLGLLSSRTDVGCCCRTEHQVRPKTKTQSATVTLS